MANSSGANRSAVFLGTVALILSFPLPASARFAPPKAVLHSDADRQEGHSVTYTEGRREGEGMCSVTHGDGFYEWPRALEHDTERKLHLRFRKDRKPDTVRIRDYRKINRQYNSPKGDPRKVPYKLRRLRNGNDKTIAWEAVFRRRAPGHHYLDVEVSWRGEHQCQHDSAEYNFHVKTLV